MRTQVANYNDVYIVGCTGLMETALSAAYALETGMSGRWRQCVATHPEEPIRIAHPVPEDPPRWETSKRTMGTQTMCTCTRRLTSQACQWIVEQRLAGAWTHATNYEHSRSTDVTRSNNYT